jgi:hypothetical protein
MHSSRNLVRLEVTSGLVASVQVPIDRQKDEFPNVNVLKEFVCPLTSTWPKNPKNRWKSWLKIACSSEMDVSLSVKSTMLPS